MKSLLLAAAVAFTLALGGSARAQAADCTRPAEIDAFQLLRRLSLDLRGFPPSMAEYDLVKQGRNPSDIASLWTTHWDPEGPAPDASHAGFRQQMRRYHQLLLWPNVSNVRLTNTVSSIKFTTAVDGGTPSVGWLTSTGRTKAYYTANPDWTDKPDLTNANSVPPCDPLREQPAGAYLSDPPGEQNYRPIPQTDAFPDGGSQQWVGYRVVQPYWLNDGGSVRICAYDAQETAAAYYTQTNVKVWNDGGHYTDGGAVDAGYVTVPTLQNSLTRPDGGSGGSCDSIAGQGASWCGCGPNLRYCFGSTVQTDVENDMAEQLLKVVDLTTVGGRPYTDVIMTPVSYVNGRLSFYKHYLPESNTPFSLTFTENDPAEHFKAASGFEATEPGAIPDLDYNDSTWYRVTRSSQHAGVLTLPAYLLRFQTNRSRANRFRIDFLCNYFVPPDQLNDAPPACNPSTSDLMRKCNCRLCHATLEPLAAKWGSFSEAGFSQLSDAGFPEYDPTCTPDGGSQRTSSRCQRFYVTTTEYDVPAGEVDQAEHRYGGQLKTFLYDDIHNQVLSSELVKGKDALYDEYVKPGDFAHCTVKKVFAYFMRRDMRVVGAENDEAELLEQLATDFATDYDFARLVTKVVSLPQYRRVR